MGRTAEPRYYTCKHCGKECETYRSGPIGVFCNRQCRADFERKGEAAPRSYIQNGYRMLRWTIPGGTKRKPITVSRFEHDKVWEDANGPIPDGHVIHHINGDKLDNRLANLELMERGRHTALHHRDTEKYPNGGTPADYQRTYYNRPGVRERRAAWFREYRRKRKMAS